jgi:hypothetical protein
VIGNDPETLEPLAETAEAEAIPKAPLPVTPATSAKISKVTVSPAGITKVGEKVKIASSFDKDLFEVLILHFFQPKL